jgi:hypothetical protein
MLLEVRQSVHLPHLVAIVPRLLLRIEKVLARFLHLGLDAGLFGGGALGLGQIEASCLRLLSLSLLILFLESVIIGLLLRLVEGAGTRSRLALHLRTRTRN